MMSYIKNEAKFLLDSGLLFEINRTILHKFGLALAVGIDNDNRKKVKIQGVLETDDGEGWVFDEDSFNDGKEKFEKFTKENSERLKSRKSILGYTVQEEGEK
jgi:hypothetical protein